MASAEALLNTLEHTWHCWGPSLLGDTARERCCCCCCCCRPAPQQVPATPPDVLPLKLVVPLQPLVPLQQLLLLLLLLPADSCVESWLLPTASSSPAPRALSASATSMRSSGDSANSGATEACSGAARLSRPRPRGGDVAVDSELLLAHESERPVLLAVSSSGGALGWRASGEAGEEAEAGGGEEVLDVDVLLTDRNRGASPGNKHTAAFDALPSADRASVVVLVAIDDWSTCPEHSFVSAGMRVAVGVVVSLAVETAATSRDLETNVGTSPEGESALERMGFMRMVWEGAEQIDWEVTVHTSEVVVVEFTAPRGEACRTAGLVEDVAGSTTDAVVTVVSSAVGRTAALKAHEVTADTACVDVGAALKVFILVSTRETGGAE